MSDSERVPLRDLRMDSCSPLALPALGPVPLRSFVAHPARQSAPDSTMWSPSRPLLRAVRVQSWAPFFSRSTWEKKTNTFERSRGACGPGRTNSTRGLDGRPRERSIVFVFFAKILREKKWCPRLDSNQHAVKHTTLNRACLPIPPLGHSQIECSS